MHAGRERFIYIRGAEPAAVRHRPSIPCALGRRGEDGGGALRGGGAARRRKRRKEEEEEEGGERRGEEEEGGARPEVPAPLPAPPMAAGPAREPPPRRACSGPRRGRGGR